MEQQTRDPGVNRMGRIGKRQGAETTSRLTIAFAAVSAVAGMLLLPVRAPAVQASVAPVDLLRANSDQNMKKLATVTIPLTAGAQVLAEGWYRAQYPFAGQVARPLQGARVWCATGPVPATLSVLNQPSAQPPFQGTTSVMTATNGGFLGSPTEVRVRAVMTAPVNGTYTCWLLGNTGSGLASTGPTQKLLNVLSGSLSIDTIVAAKQWGQPCDQPNDKGACAFTAPVEVLRQTVAAMPGSVNAIDVRADPMVGWGTGSQSDTSNAQFTASLVVQQMHRPGVPCGAPTQVVKNQTITGWQHHYKFNFDALGIPVNRFCDSRNFDVKVGLSAIPSQPNPYGSVYEGLFFSNAIAVRASDFHQPRVGSLGTNGTALVKEGGLNAAWITVNTGVRDIVVTGDRIGVLRTDGTALVKQGDLYGPWVTVHTNVTSLVLSGDRIGVVRTDGSALVKEGDLTSPWVTVFAGVKSLALGGDRVGVVLPDGSGLVKEGGLAAAWVTEATGVASLMLTRDRIGIVKTDGSALVKEGSLFAAWVTMYVGVRSLVMAGDRLGVVLPDGTALVKEGSLFAAWVTEDTGVSSLTLAGDRIGVVKTTGAASVEQGSLFAAWVTMNASGVATLALT